MKTLFLAVALLLLANLLMGCAKDVGTPSSRG